MAAPKMMITALTIHGIQMTTFIDHPSSYGFEIHPDATHPSGLRYVFYINPPKIRVISFKGGGARVQVYGKLIEEIEKRDLYRGTHA
jgi:hypothetical protein